MELVLGRVGGWSTLASNLVGPFTIMISYQMIAADMLVSPILSRWSLVSLPPDFSTVLQSSLAGEWSGDHCNQIAERKWSVTMCVLPILCLTLLKRFDDLKLVSLLATIANVYLMVVIVVESGEAIGDRDSWECGAVRMLRACASTVCHVTHR
jgi:amino acid permease